MHISCNTLQEVLYDKSRKTERRRNGKGNVAVERSGLARNSSAGVNGSTVENGSSVENINPVENSSSVESISPVENNSPVGNTVSDR